MNQLNPKAWEVLTPDEQTAITLNIVQNLSTLKAGEIMAKAHYKYLEILERAKAFIKIFSEFLAIYDDILPKYVSIDSEFREYLHYTVVERMPVKEACSQISVPYWMYKQYREKKIIRNMLKLSRSNQIFNIQFFELIKEFDRWNNCRILPYAVQDPSAFKRRAKNSDIKNMRHVYGINEYSVKKIIEKYKFRTNSPQAKLGYFVVFPKGAQDHIIPVRLKSRTRGKALTELGRLGIYIFKNQEDAEEYYTMVVSYLKDRKNCRYGQKFWPKYRTHIKQSLNYNYILKVIPSRKHFLQSLTDMDFILAKDKK